MSTFKNEFSWAISRDRVFQIWLYICKCNQTVKIENMNCVLIAEVHNSAKVWITYTEYTISESNAGGEILHLRYKNNITMIYNFIRIPISWSYM